MENQDLRPIRPTVGRVLHFYAHSGSEPRTAFIAMVHNDYCINVGVLDHDGSFWEDPPTSVRLLQPGESRPESGGWCEWMPYQQKKSTGSESGERAAGTQAI